MSADPLRHGAASTFGDPPVVPQGTTPLSCASTITARFNKFVRNGDVEAFRAFVDGEEARWPPGLSTALTPADRPEQLRVRAQHA
jgi:hypothetical protein